MPKCLHAKALPSYPLGEKLSPEMPWEVMLLLRRRNAALKAAWAPAHLCMPWHSASSLLKAAWAPAHLCMPVHGVSTPLYAPGGLRAVASLTAQC